MFAADLLDRTLPRASRVVLLLLCASIPTAYLARQYEQRHDLSPVIDYGQFFAPRQLPEIRAMHPAIGSFLGYDGQFYVQIALDPALRRPELPRTMDSLAYRGQRILLPALAWLLGGGRPRAIVLVYALLNLAFFYTLLASLARRLPAETPRDFLILYAIMLTTGSLISMEYALTDLPAATFAFISLNLAEAPAGLFLALAILTKPTYALFLLGRAVRLPAGLVGWARLAAGGALILAPFALWEAYLRHVTRGSVVDATQFTLPFTAWCKIALGNGRALAEAPGPWRGGGAWTAWFDAFFQLFAQLSLSVQVIFLASRPQWRRPVWIIGAAFACLLVCLPEKTLLDEEGYTRTVLPLTIAFNLLLRDVRPARPFLALLVLGNIGLLEGLGEMLWIIVR